MGRVTLLLVLLASSVTASSVTASSVTASAASGSPASGQLDPAVRELELTVHPGVGGRFGGRVDVEIRYRVVNRGSHAVQPTTRLRVTSQIGGGVTRGPTPIPSLAPGASFPVHERVTGVLPFGSVTATVTVRASGTTTTASASTAVVPWFALLSLAIGALAGWAIGRGRRRRRTTQGQRSGQV